MKDVRLRGGDLQTATHEYYNPMTGRWFRLIGVCHVADARFWHHTQQYIKAQEVLFGGEIHYEGVTNDVPGSPDIVPQGSLTSFAEALGLRYQKEGLTYRAHWIRTDLTLSEVLAKMDDPDKFLASMSQMGQSLAEGTALAKELPFVARLLRRVLRYGIIYGSIFFKSDERKVILDERNRYAVSTMVSSGTDIITVWGAGHLKGMRKILEDCGYERRSTNWTTCIPRKTTI